MITFVPPAEGPAFGETEVTVGVGGTAYVYLSADVIALVPADVTTVTSTVLPLLQHRA